MVQQEDHYAAKHNPMVFFDDVTDGGQLSSVRCIAHERPYSELATDLQRNAVARYNFITPDLCHDMHNTFGCPTLDSVKRGNLRGNAPAWRCCKCHRSQRPVRSFPVG